MRRSLQSAGPLPAPPGVWGPFEIEREIGSGRQGRVYAATHCPSAQPCALKVFLALGESTRLLRELELMTQFSHPALARCLTSGEHAGRLYLALELLEGGSLEGLGKVSPLRAIAMTRELALGLDYLHRQGVVHRDVNPSNVLLDSDGHPKLVDLGLAKLAHQPLTAPDEFLGTAVYSAPEQLERSREVDARADVFSLGGVLFFLLSGQEPFPSRLPFADLVAAVREGPRPVVVDHTLSDQVSSALNEILLRALAADLDSRFADMHAFVLALEGVGSLLRPQTAESRDVTLWDSLKLSSTQAEDPRAELPGSWGPYTLQGMIAEGGMGQVYRAHHEGLGRDVAIKALAGRSYSSRARQRFLIEARAMARLRDPHVVAIHDLGEVAGVPYLVFDLIPGEDLEVRLCREGRIQAQEAADIARQIALALVAAHSASVLHRDVKPANILLPPGKNVLLTDFGLARDLDEVTGLTLSGRFMGSYGYTAPEQAKGELARVGPRSDLFSLGATLYRMLTGTEPFGGIGPSYLDALDQGKPIAPSERVPDIPADLERICLTCLQIRPEERYGTAEALAEDLDRFLRGQALVGRPQRLPRWKRWLLPLAAAGVLAGAWLGLRASQGEFSPSPRDTPQLPLPAAASPGPSVSPPQVRIPEEAEALFGLGVDYEQGIGRPADAAKAASLYLQAAELGHPAGMNNVGICFWQGVGVSPDFAKAFEWFQKAAELGNPEGIYHLGRLYEEGAGTPVDAPRAIALHRQAAGLGISAAKDRLGRAYQFGIGVELDLETAFGWYRQAAEGGFPRGMSNLGYMYQFAVGVERDLEMAEIWFRRGAALNEPYALANLAVLLINHGGRGTTPEIVDLSLSATALGSPLEPLIHVCAQPDVELEERRLEEALQAQIDEHGLVTKVELAAEELHRRGSRWAHSFDRWAALGGSLPARVRLRKHASQVAEARRQLELLAIAEEFRGGG